MDAKLKVRQPLAGVEVILSDASHQAWLDENADILKEELNVKEIKFTQNADQYISYLVQPNFKRLGQRVRHLMPKVKKALGEADGAELLQQFNDIGKVVLDFDGETVELDNEDIEVRLQAKEGWSAAQGKSSVVVLSTDLSDELIREGYARDLVRYIQDLRKETGLDFNDEIELALVTESGDLAKAIEENAATVQTEVQAKSLSSTQLQDASTTEKSVGDFSVQISIRKVN